MRVTQDQLVDIVAKSDADNITVVYEGEVQMLKTGNPFYTKQGRSFVPVNSVTKRSIDTFGFGLEYENEVKSELRRNGENGDFVSAPIAWGDFVVPCKVIKHKGTGELYLRVFADVYIENRPDEAGRVTEYYVDGEPATEEQMATIEEFAPKYNGTSKKQEQAGLPRAEQVKPRTLKFSNIISVVIDNKMYELV